MIAMEETASHTAPSDGPKRPRVLIVDDEDSIRLLIREALSEYGYDVDTAADGAEGSALFELIKHDLVLTDLMMPAITGLGPSPTVAPSRSDAADHHRHRLWSRLRR